MGYLMRYFSTDERNVTLPEIEIALQKYDPAYSIVLSEVPALGDLMYSDIRCAIIELNFPGDDIFEDDLNSFRDMVRGDSLPEQRVRQTLDATTLMVVVEAFWEGENSEPVLLKIDPLWDWLFANLKGLSQADSEGFYDAHQLILEQKFIL